MNKKLLFCIKNKNNNNNNNNFKNKIDIKLSTQNNAKIILNSKNKISLNKAFLLTINRKSYPILNNYNNKNSKVIESIASKESKLSKIDLKKINNNTIIGIKIVNSNPYFTHQLTSKEKTIINSRSLIVLNYIKKVCNNFPNKINCELAIGLNDSHDNINEGLMVFSKKINSNCILIPDIYSINNYAGKINKSDNITSKINESLFIGATTGNNNPENNSRLKLCNFSLNNKNIKGYINNICQISEEGIAKTYPKYKNFMRKSMSIEDQIKYKYLINIDGNTCAWDRLPWVLNTKSICLKQKSNNKCWYYDLLENNKHYIEFNEPNDIISIMNNLSHDKYNYIIKNANIFVNEYLREQSHMLYMGYLLYNLSLTKK